MEALLLDPSSEESDTEDVSKVPASASAVAATIQPTSSPTPPLQQVAPSASQAQAQQAQNQPPPTNKTELSQRLKSLYSPASHANKKTVPTPTLPAPPLPQQQQQQQPAPQPPGQMTPSSRPPSHSSYPPQQQHMLPPGQAPRQTIPTARSIPPGGASRGSSSSGILHAVAPQQQQQQQQSGYASPPSQQTTLPQQTHFSQPLSSHPQQPSYTQPPSYGGRTSSSSGSQQQQHRSSSMGSGSVGVPNPVPHGSIPPPGQRRSNAGPSTGGHDPFEPTPLHQIQRTTVGGPSTSYKHGGSSSGGGASVAASVQQQQQQQRSTSAAASEREKEMRRQKERFLMFTRVLMKYLETKDPDLHRKVKQIIKECAERNKRQEPGYESVTASMRERLKQVVGDNYWKRAESYLQHFLTQKKMQQAQQQAGGSATAPQPGGSVVVGASEAQRQAELKRRQEMEKRQRVHQQQQEHHRMQQQQQSTSQAAQQPQTQQGPTHPQTPAPAPQQQQQPPTAPAMVPPTQKPARTASTTTGGKGKRAAGGKQASGGKAGKKARTVKAATATTSRGSKVAGATMAPSPLGQQQSPSQPQTPNPMLPATAVDPNRPPSPPPTREYSELMEEVEHAVHFDWTAAGLIMGSNLQRLQLQEEQKNLLYGSTTTYYSADSKHSSQQLMISPSAVEEKTPFSLRGWGKRNLVSPRVAWCRLRRREQPTEHDKAKLKALYPDAPPAHTPASAWLNEDKAEEDPALCLLSEATQIYISQVLQTALVCAHQRQNLDGIRLWHQQCMAAMVHAKLKKDGDKDGDGSQEKKFTPPPLSIKLGCAVPRQVARTSGNAALITKRMEEALDRAKTCELTRVLPSKDAFKLDQTTFLSASSMGELSLLPPLANATERADYEAKRQFEIYGGKHSHEPPFGRVPKIAKLEAADFQRGLKMNHYQGGGRSRRHRASPASFSWGI